MKSNPLKWWKTPWFWLALMALSLFMGLLGFGFTTDPKLVPSPLILKAAPNFKIYVFNRSDETMELLQWQGQPVVLNFWASWCMECQTEAKVLESAYQEYEVKGKKVKFLGIAIQDKQESAEKFAQHFGKTYRLALDDTSGKIALDYGIYGVPETFFIDAKGIIRSKKVGGLTDKNIREQIEQLLLN